ncbi:MAG: hypothetical protein ACKOEM_08435 [Planctomycetia bacterium]
MLKLNTGITRKIGLPEYGSAGASCNLEVELDTSLFHDLEGLHQVVRRAYAACNQAVQDELARLGAATNGTGRSKARAAHEVVEVSTSPTVGGTRLTTASSNGGIPPSPATRPATAAQVKALKVIASRKRIDLASLLRKRFGLMAPNELGIRQASELIDELKADEDTNANGRGDANGAFVTNGGGR